MEGDASSNAAPLAAGHGAAGCRTSNGAAGRGAAGCRIFFFAPIALRVLTWRRWLPHVEWAAVPDMAPLAAASLLRLTTTTTTTTAETIKL